MDRTDELKSRIVVKRIHLEADLKNGRERGLQSTAERLNEWLKD